MNYQLIKDLVEQVQQFEIETAGKEASATIPGFANWLANKFEATSQAQEKVDWEGKVDGRSVESVIATQLVHLNRYAKNYFKSAIHGTDFSTPDEVIYLIVLKFSNPLTKMELIKKNVHEKPAGMQIINRLIYKGWVDQMASETDKRSKVLRITQKGLATINPLLLKIRVATNLVSGPLSATEKEGLITLLQKLEAYHHPIYEKQYNVAALVEKATSHLNNKQQQ